MCGFICEMDTLGGEQTFAFYSHYKGNGGTEKVMRTVREELVWINEFRNFEKINEGLAS